MEAQGLLKAGVGLTALGIVLGLGGALLDDALTRSLAGLATLFGLAALIFALYRLAGLPRMPTLVLTGGALFVLGRLTSTLVGLALPRGSFADPGVQLLFALLSVASNLGTILLFVGVFRALRDRLGRTSPAPAASPAPALPRAPVATRPTSIKPPRAPLPTKKQP